MKIKKVLSLLSGNGWYIFSEGKNIYQLKHPIKLGIITIAGRKSSKLLKLSLQSIFSGGGIL